VAEMKVNGPFVLLNRPRHFNLLFPTAACGPPCRILKYLHASPRPKKDAFSTSEDMLSPRAIL